MQIDARPAVDLDLDQAGAGGEGVGQSRQRVEAAMRQLEEGGGPGGVDPARRAEQRLELLAAERLGLGEEVKDAAPVVVDDDYADRRLDRAQGGEAADVV